MLDFICNCYLNKTLQDEAGRFERFEIVAESMLIHVGFDSDVNINPSC